MNIAKYLMTSQFLKLIAAIALVLPLSCNAACGFTDKKITFTDGAKACLNEFSFLNVKGLMKTKPNESYSSQAKSQSSYAIAVTADPMLCPFEQSMQWDWSGDEGNRAVSSCESKMTAAVQALGKSANIQSCKCEILIDNGKTKFSKAEFDQRTKQYERQIALGFRPIQVVESQIKEQADREAEAIRQAEMKKREEEIIIARREQKEREEKEEAERKKNAPTNAITMQKSIKAFALVIGNSAYPGSSRLKNPVNDARAFSSKLRELGFKVTEVIDTDRSKLVNTLSQFSRTASDADLSLLFYAGHGVQITGTNYMLPIDLNLNDLTQAPLQGISLNDVVEKYLPGKTKLVFLDACRDNPLMQVASRSVSKGLAPINVSEGTLISYATKDGSVAQDGEGNNSPFTSALLEHIGDPDDIAVVLRKVRERVMKTTGNKQQPWEYGSLTGGALVLSAIRPR